MSLVLLKSAELAYKIVLAPQPSPNTKEDKAMIRVAVCDDDIVFANIIKEKLEEVVNQFLYDYIFSIDIFYDSIEMLNRIKTLNYEAVIIDIDMPNLSGFDISSYVRKHSGLETSIIFISGKDDMVFDSIEYLPLSFIRKSKPEYISHSLHQSILKIIHKYQYNKAIVVNDVCAGTIHLPISSIVYVCSDKHYVEYLLNSKNNHLVERSSLDQVELKIDNKCFIRTHQRYLVNANFIVSIGSFCNRITMKDGITIPISRQRLNSVSDMYSVYCREKALLWN